jgi:NADH-quinone oxidoreductase subunit F
MEKNKIIFKKTFKEKKIILKEIKNSKYDGKKISSYLKKGGYETYKKSLKKNPNELFNEIIHSQLRGRGGAGFSVALKWKFALLNKKKEDPIYLICNADESEPGTFKDRQIIYKDPHQLLEGILISSLIIKPNKIFIYIRGEMVQGERILINSIKEAKKIGMIGKNIFDSKHNCDIIIYKGAGSYICGEETGLIESIEGKRPYPRIKPQFFPALHGLYGFPTIVNNVETFCHIKHIIKIGGKNYSRIGKENNTGTRVWSVSGHVKKPGFYEYACGSIKLGELIYNVCGGLEYNRKLQAVIPGGISSKILKAGKIYKGLINKKNFSWKIEDIPLDFDSLLACGTMSGSGGIIVIDDRIDMVDLLANINYFYSHESCGQCTPCREGSYWISMLSKELAIRYNNKKENIDLIYSIADQIEGKTICAFGEACSWPTKSIIKNFKKEILNDLKKNYDRKKLYSNYKKNWENPPLI